MRIRLCIWPKLRLRNCFLQAASQTIDGIAERAQAIEVLLRYRLWFWPKLWL
jgi:hypothetical protein